ncbi:hypothetical protein QF043_003609 [Pseudomonas sp. W3I7]|uniref:hypothetical protein n=1 Tax=Pseudomonas sp. W3I7 TaxID=3042292 RepID=UPI00278E6393|nr:hypothetical protein [Pseudomonas sp. W3I7]MDQ0704817.1 hypothetical protein [Pseudomonas sp. W3I7]
MTIGARTLYYGSGHLHQLNLNGRVICGFERDALHEEVPRTQGALHNHTSIQPALKDRSYTFSKHFRRPPLKYPTVTKNDEPFSTINVMYSVVLGKKPTFPFIS